MVSPLTIPPADPRNTPPLKLTPIMAQYLQLKEDYSDSLLFFRLGDFYELFFDDAIIASRDMDIVLTKRGKNEGQDIPMCGVPVHAYETYLGRLIQKGHKIAICEQVEDPETAKKRGNKGPLKREVVRVITPGTLTEEAFLPPNQNNFLVAISPVVKSDIGVAVIDLSTGTFFIESTDITHLPAVIDRLNPAEIILPDLLLQETALFESLHQWKKKLVPLPKARFDWENGRNRLEDIYQVKALDAFGRFSEAEIRAAGALIDYIQLTQKSAIQLIAPPRQIKQNQFMSIDPATRKSLELHVTQSGQRKGSLLSTIDYTLTSAGSRMLGLYLSAPLLHEEHINHRLDAVEFLVQTQEIHALLKETLTQCPDMERALSRLNLGRGNPRDLKAILEGLSQAEHLKQMLKGVSLPFLLQEILSKIGSFDQIIDTLRRALAETLPFHVREGNFIAPDYHSELDSFRYFRDHSKEHLATLQDRYIAQTGISSLKIKHNHIIGYHIDINPNHVSKVPDIFIHRQTMVSSLRYTTPELGEIEKKILSAAQQILQLEKKLFEELTESVKQYGFSILQCCRSLATIDVLSSFASLALDQGYNRPLVDQSLQFDVRSGVHPVVVSALKEQGKNVFIPNDCSFEGEGKIFLITGPNMAGKSTYLRQNALIAILAQIGCFVPASSAHIGVIDRIFSRVGAADDLAAGRSTFMVEMVETATILHQSTDRSFIILDEIGRGTATYDGLSLAWAIIETIAHEKKCRTLFATHYHELTQLESTLPSLVCKTMRIREWDEKVIFLHEVISGAANRSYGIHVAALAGLPPQVIHRATQILETLEKGAVFKKPLSNETSPHQLPLIDQYLLDLDLDQLSPREALETLYQMKKKALERKG